MEDVEIDIALPPIKRKRGRPRKVKSDPIDSTVLAEQLVSTQMEPGFLGREDEVLANYGTPIYRLMVASLEFLGDTKSDQVPVDSIDFPFLFFGLDFILEDDPVRVSFLDDSQQAEVPFSSIFQLRDHIVGDTLKFSGVSPTVQSFEDLLMLATKPQCLDSSCPFFDVDCRED